MASEKKMKWDEQAEAKLFVAVLGIFEVKFSVDKLQQLADIMGFTSKAIIHRIANIKSRCKNVMDGVEPATPTPAKRKKRRNAEDDEGSPTTISNKQRAITKAKTPYKAAKDEDDEISEIERIKRDGHDIPVEDDD